jgi:tetratricopeptide (TPR) repeat protein
MSKYLAAIFVLGLSSTALAQDLTAEEREGVLQRLRERKKNAGATATQDGDVELRKRILEKVAAKLAADRSALLKRIERIIDEELSKAPAAKTPAQPEGDAQVKELEKKMRLLEEQKETLAAEMAKAKRLAADEALREEARKDGPHDAEEVQEVFDNALELHDKNKNFREAIKLFKRIYYNHPKTKIGAISAYNVACGYALSGSKEEAIDWLEISVKAGYSDFNHLRKDTDLDSLRNEKRYKKLLTDR